ncbi:MAG: VOC family protein [Candidatus Aminicenantes bacterium]|nr:MAG: VOC family protein [Candidatus Aminicenantes bacterium]
MKIKSLSLLFVLFYLAACSSTQLIVPPVTTMPTNDYKVGKFVWYDLLTDDVLAVKKFYGGLFGWQFEGEERIDAEYTVILQSGTPIGGIVFRKEKKVDHSQWLSYLSVADVDRAVEMIKAKNGIIYREPFELPNRGRVAVVADPQGAAIVLIKSQTGDPEDRDLITNNWLWTELFASDIKKAADFYSQLVGYTVEEFDTGLKIPYYVFKQNSTLRGGLLKIPWEGVKPNWLPYVLVDDPGKIAGQVQSLGGQVLIAPNKDIRQGSVALIQDPMGAVFAIQKWPIE